MTVRAGPLPSPSTLSAQQDRRARNSPWPVGVLLSGDGLVAAQGTPNMSVQVAVISWALVDDGIATGAGKYWFETDAIENPVIATSDPALPRDDIIVCKCQDTEAGDGSNTPLVTAIAGTPNASPSPPATPARCLLLAKVRVDAGVTNIQGNKITDQRVYTGLDEKLKEVPRFGLSADKGKQVVAGTGTANVTSGQSGTSTTISFGHTFTNIPKVQVTITGIGGSATGNYIVRLTAKSTTGFTVFIIKPDGSAFGASGTVDLDWEAIG